jgi:NitT/TauT family transport system substrate-binding protein
VAAAAGAAVMLSACSSGGGSGGGGGGAAAANATNASSGGVVTVKVACSPSVQQIPRDLAAEQGLDTKAGVKPECVQVQTGPAQSAALLSGDLSVGIMTPSNMVPLLDKKQDLVTFGSMWDVNNFDIVVGKDVALPDASQGWQGVMKDLKGKKIGVPARGAAGENLARALFEQAGMSGDSAAYIPTGLANTTVAALQSKAIDAAITFEPGITLALQQGIATQPFSIQKGTGPSNMKWSDLLFVTTRNYAEKNKATLCKFTKAWDAGLQYMQNPANRSSVEASTSTFLGLKPADSKALLDNNLSFFPTTTKLEAAKVDPGFAFQKQYSGASKAYTVSEIGVDVCS